MGKRPGARPGKTIRANPEKMEEGQMEQVKAVIDRMLITLAAPNFKREEGQTLVEYALIIVTISIGVTAAMLFLRDQIDAVFSTIGSAL